MTTAPPPGASDTDCVGALRHAAVLFGWHNAPHPCLIGKCTYLLCCVVVVALALALVCLCLKIISV